LISLKVLSRLFRHQGSATHLAEALMNPVLILVALVLAVAVVQSVLRSPSESEQRLEALEQRREALEQRVDALAQRLDELALASSSAGEPDQAEPSTPSAADGAVDWRHAEALQGQPLRVAAEHFDARRGRLELLLEITSPLPDAERWRAQPGQPVPLILTARDAIGEAIITRPMTLLRGPSLEPGAYLHLGAELTDAAADRVRVIQVDRAAAIRSSD
jgi:hypothetical protein